VAMSQKVGKGDMGNIPASLAGQQSVTKRKVEQRETGAIQTGWEQRVSGNSLRKQSLTQVGIRKKTKKKEGRWGGTGSTGKGDEKATFSYTHIGGDCTRKKIH